MERTTWIDEAARAAFPPEAGTERRSGLARAVASNLLFAFQGWPGSAAEREQWARHFREEPHDTPAAVQARREDVRARVLLALRDRFVSFQRKRYALLALANLHALGIGDAHELKRYDRVWWVLPSLRDYLRDALLGPEGLGGDHAFARSCELESAISQADPPQMPTAQRDAAEGEDGDAAPDPSGSTVRALREHGERWNAAFDGYRRKVKALCWTPAAPRRTAFGELLAVDFGFGLPPHEGLDPANRLLGAALCAALRGIGEADPEYTLLLSAGLTRDRVRLFQALRALLDRNDREEPHQVAAVVALVVLAHLQDRDGPAPDPGVFQVGPRWVAERALKGGRVPARAASLVSRFLNDALAGPELVSEGRALLAPNEERSAGPARAAGSGPGRDGAAERTLLDLTDDGLALTLGGHELRYIKSDGSRRVTIGGDEGQLLLSLARPGGVRAHVTPEAVSHLRYALRHVPGTPVSLEGRGDGLRLSVPVRMGTRLHDMRAR